MTQVLLMLKTHQPVRIAEYSFFDLGKHKNYFNENLNQHIIDRIADNCYLPVNELLMKLIDHSGENFKFSISISGTTIDQLEAYRPDVLESFVKLVNTKQVEVVCEPYYYSLAFANSPEEFEDQVEMHRQKIISMFSTLPATFLNTEFCFNNEVAKQVKEMGFEGIITEGADRMLHGRNPNKIYGSTIPDLNLFFRNYRLSDDVKFKYSDYTWKSYPLTPNKYYTWIKNAQSEIVNLFYDYENFGEHHKKETGIFDFLEKTLVKLLNTKSITFNRFKDIKTGKATREVIDVPFTISRADVEKDLSAWKSNAMQYESLARIYELEKKVKATDSEDLMQQWRLLQTADHFYYMSTKGLKDGRVHKNFSPFYSPHDAYRYYMNILSDFELKVNKSLSLSKVPVTGPS